MKIHSITGLNICFTDNDFFYKIYDCTDHLNLSYQKLYNHNQYFCLPINDISKNDESKCNDINDIKEKIIEELLETKQDEIPIKVKKRKLLAHWQDIFSHKKYYTAKFHRMNGNLDEYLNEYYENNENILKNVVINVIITLSILETCELTHGDLHIKNVLYQIVNDDHRFMLCDFDTCSSPMTLSWHASQPRWLEKRYISLLHIPLNSVYWDLYVFINSLRLTLDNKKKWIPRWVIVLEKESLQKALQKKIDGIINLIKLVDN